MAVPWYAVLLLAGTVLGASFTSLTTATDNFTSSDNQFIESAECGKVWLTVHSPERQVSGRTILDALELNWNFHGCTDANIPRQIGIFRGTPTAWSTALVIYPVTTWVGHIVTDIPLGEATLPGGWLTGPSQVRGAQCLWPWVGAGNANIDARNCLKIQPTWMQDHDGRINHLPIGELVLPGTHNSGSWRFNTGNNNNARDRFVLCQDRSIWAQLVHGIRYFDFRIAYYENQPDRYWLNHNMIRVRPLQPLLQEIRLFLDHTKEVVFLDAHHFPVGFYDPSGAPIWSVHNGLIDLMRQELGPHMADASQFLGGSGSRGPTLQVLVNSDKRLLFSYIDNAIVAAHPSLWPRLPHLWANTNRVQDLFEFLDQAIANSPNPNERNPMHSAMAQTTPTALDIVLLRGSIRDNAYAVNRHVTTRLVNAWRPRANIVASDFFLGNDVIDMAIALSIQRGGQL